MTSFAHTAAGGGTNLEQIALAVAVVALGLAFLVQKTVDRRVSVGLVAFGLIALIGSLTFLRGFGEEPAVTVGGEEFSETELQDAVVGLCSARESATEDVDGAETAFLDRAHEPLHVLVAAIEDDDRALAGRLLVAKQVVEAEFDGDRDPQELEQDMDELLSVTVEALEVVGIEAHAC